MAFQVVFNTHQLNIWFQVSSLQSVNQNMLPPYHHTGGGGGGGSPAALSKSSPANPSSMLHGGGNNNADCLDYSAAEKAGNNSPWKYQSFQVL